MQEKKVNDVLDGKLAARPIIVHSRRVPRMQPYQKIIVAIMVATLFLSVVNISIAAAAEPPQDPAAIVLAQSQDRRGPPREAIEACADKDVGDACSFQGRGDGAAGGTCQSPVRDRPAVCVPEGGPRG